MVQADGEAQQQGETQGKLASLAPGDPLEELPRELAPVRVHHRRQQRLHLARESGHVAVLEDVGAVLVVAGVGDRETDLVHPRRPLEHLGTELGVELPGRARPLEEGERGLLHALRLRVVDLVARRDGRDAAVARVLVRRPVEQLVDDSLAQRAAGRLQHLDPELLEGGEQDRDAAREDRRPVFLEPGQRELVQRLALLDRLHQTAQRVEVDLSVRPAVHPQHLADGQDRPGGAARAAPAQLAEGLAQRGELQRGGDLGALEIRAAELSVREELRGVADAAHVEAVQRDRLEALADDALGAAAPDVDHEMTSLGFGAHVGHTEVDQAGLLAPGDDLDRMTQGLGGVGEELLAVVRHAQGVGADRAHRAARHAAQTLAEALQRLERAPHDAVREHAVARQAAGQAHGIAQAVEDVHAAVRFGARHHHVEAVRAEVDARDDLFARDALQRTPSQTRSRAGSGTRSG